MGNSIGQMAPSLQQFHGMQDKGMGGARGNVIKWELRDKTTKCNV